MLLQKIVFSQNRKSSGVTVGMMRSLNTKKKITNSRVIKLKDKKIVFFEWQTHLIHHRILFFVELAL